MMKLIGELSYKGSICYLSNQDYSVINDLFRYDENEIEISDSKIMVMIENQNYVQGSGESGIILYSILDIRKDNDDYFYIKRLDRYYGYGSNKKDTYFYKLDQIDDVIELKNELYSILKA